MLSVDGRMIPFIEHNDPTRAQMTCGQIRQAVSLLNPDIPQIRTGYEEQYLHESTFMFEAEYDGVVLYIDDDIMIIYYANPETPGDVIQLGGKNANFDGFDKRVEPTVKSGDRFSKGDIIAKHHTINESGFLQLGKNLRTTYISCPYTYKDAIVISESCAKKLSIKYVNYEEFSLTESLPVIWKDNDVTLKQNTYVKKGDPLFLIKPREPRNVSDLIYPGKIIYSKSSGYFTYEINSYSEIETVKQERAYYNKVSDTAIYKDKIKAQIIDKVFEKYPYLADAYKRRFAPHSSKLTPGKVIQLKYWITETKPIIKGSKISNRHGNKGVVSAIFPDSEMPQFIDGPAEVIINPLSIPSRMNVGQLFELHLTRTSFHVLNKIKKYNSYEEKEAELFKYLYMCCEKQLVDDYKETFNKENMAYIISSGYIQLIQRPFNSISFEDLLAVCYEYGMDKDLKESCVFNGVETRASVGINYIMRLEHEPYKKLFGRSVGPMGRNGQPIKGGNAHRFGELEVWSMIAHQAHECLIELMIPKSDNAHESARMLKYFHDGKEKNYTPQNLTVGAAEILTTILKGAGVKLTID